MILQNKYNCTLKVLLVLLTIIVVYACNKQVPFDRENWIHSGGELIMTDNRFNMTDDLLNSNLLINKSKSEIDSLLGYSLKSTESDHRIYLYIVKEVYSSDIDPDELIYIAVTYDSLDTSLKAELIRKE